MHYSPHQPAYSAHKLNLLAATDSMDRMAGALLNAQVDLMVIIKKWAKREEQIERVMGTTVGMYGDLQGIAGKSFQEIEGLELPAPDRSAE